METSDDRIVLQVLRFLGDIYDTTADFCRQLREEFAVAGQAMLAPTYDIVCRTYKKGMIRVIIHIWVEVMFQGEDSLVGR